MKLLCRLGWHRWTQWKWNEQVVQRTIDGEPAGRDYYDMRECRRCRRREFRKVLST